MACRKPSGSGTPANVKATFPLDTISRLAARKKLLLESVTTRTSSMSARA